MDHEHAGTTKGDFIPAQFATGSGNPPGVWLDEAQQVFLQKRFCEVFQMETDEVIFHELRLVLFQRRLQRVERAFFVRTGHGANTINVAALVLQSHLAGDD